MMRKFLAARDIQVTYLDYFIFINSLFFLMITILFYYDRFVQYRGAANIHEFFIYAAVIFTAIFLFWSKFRHLPIRLSTLVLIEFTIFMHFSGAFVEIDGHRLYELRLFDIRYDKFVHLVNSMIATYLTLYFFVKRGLILTDFVLLVAVFTVLGVGAVVEIVEFGVALTVQHNGVGSYNNNMFDLVANLIGSAIIVILYKYLFKTHVEDH